MAQCCLIKLSQCVHISVQFAHAYKNLSTLVVKSQEYLILGIHLWLQAGCLPAACSLSLGLQAQLAASLYHQQGYWLEAGCLPAACSLSLGLQAWLAAGLYHQWGYWQALGWLPPCCLLTLPGAAGMAPLFVLHVFQFITCTYYRLYYMYYRS